jgi:ABC-type Zn uptake system ZnuABC Zn-binding protein ZnuA
MAIGRRTRIVAALAVVAVVIVAGTAVLLSSNSSNAKTGKLGVVASFYPLYYFSSEIGKEHVDVSMLIPDNSEPHTWEPSPSDIIKVNDADILVYNGQGFEPWMDTVLSSVDNDDLVVVDSSQNISLLLSDEITEAYEQAVEAFNGGLTSVVTATDSEASAPTMSAEGYVNVNFSPLASGNGGYIKVSSMNGGDIRLFVTNATEFTIRSSTGTELEYELESGAVSSYPQFNGSKFVELGAGEVYSITFSSNSTGTGLIMIAGEEEGEGGHEHGLNDPHIWLDPISAKAQVSNILKAFVAADPSNATAYQQNADDLKSRLDVLNQEFVNGLAKRTKNAIITTHEGFNYLAMRYGFDAYAAIGISADAQPSAADLAALADMVDQLGLDYVFSEPIFSDSIIDTIAEETGAQVLVLDGIHSRTGAHSNMDYFEIMRANLESLRTGLEVTP